MRLTRRDIVGSLALGWPFLATPARAEQPPYMPRMRFPEVGESWTWRRTVTIGSDEKVFHVTHRRDPDIVIDGQPCVGITDGRTVTVANYDGEQVAIFVDGKMTVRMVIPIPFAVWPLRIGARQESQHRALRIADRKEISWRMVRSVEAYETVTVPAGTFWAFRTFAQSQFPDGRLTSTTQWWAPSLSNGVKLQIVSKMPNGSLSTEISELIAPPAIS